MVGFGALAELLQGSCVYLCVADVNNDVQPFPQMIGTLHNHIQCLDALSGHMTLCGYLGLSAIQVHADQYPKLVVQWNPPPWVAATLRPNPTVNSAL